MHSSAESSLVEHAIGVTSRGGKPNPSRAKTRPASEPQDGQLYAYILPAWDSFAIHELFACLGCEVDESTGILLRVRMIGDPEQSGDLYKKSLSPNVKARTEEQAKEYVRRFVQTHRERHHVLSESKRIASHIGVDPSQLPCIAFVRSRELRLLATWQIDRIWLASEGRRNTLGDCILDWLNSSELRGILTQDLPDARLTDELSKQLKILEDSVRQAVGDALLEDEATLAKARSAAKEIPNSKILILNRLGPTFHLYGAEGKLTPTRYRGLCGLADAAGKWVSYAELLRAAGIGDEVAVTDEEQTARDLKYEIMEALRGAVSRARMPREAADKLIESGGGCYRLILAPHEVHYRS